MGPDHGDATSVGYELLYRQVTRAQGIFSPRTVNVQFSLDYIAENLDAPTVVLQYPSKSELIKELKKGYDYVGISFLMAIFHKVKDMVALIREHSPQTKIILGGYGTPVMLSTGTANFPGLFGYMLLLGVGILGNRALLRRHCQVHLYRQPGDQWRFAIGSIRVAAEGADAAAAAAAGTAANGGAAQASASEVEQQFDSRHLVRSGRGSRGFWPNFESTKPVACAFRLRRQL